MPSNMDPTIRHLPEASRFEILIDGRAVGRAEYRQRDGIRAFTRTEVDESQRGRGVAGALVAGALEQTRGDGFEVEPQCPFVRSYIHKHPELIDLVPEDRRERFGLREAAETAPKGRFNVPG